MKANTMIRQTLHLACLLAVSIGITSCSGLKSKYYVGEQLDISEDDLAQESVWEYGDNTYYVRRTGSNTYVMATLEWNEDKGDYTVNSYPVVPSKLGEHLFLNIKGLDYYMIFRVALAGENELILFRADKEKLVQDIADGIVCAHTNEHNEVIMDGTKEEQGAYIQKNIDSMFSIDSPSIARLISEKKKQKKEPTQAKSAE